MPKRKPRELQPPNVGTEPVPPGATRQAFDREKPPKDGSALPEAGSRRRPRRQTARDRAADPADQAVHAKDRAGLPTPAGYQPPDPLDPTPSGDHRGDSTVGTDPTSGTD